MTRPVLLVVTLLLAGCTDSSTDDACLDCLQPADPATGLVANDTVEAPTWAVGDVFEQHMFFGREDTQGRHIKTIVVAADASGYTIATPDEEAARFEAVYDYPILGRIDAQNLGTTAFGSDWSWMYRFPLTDGMTGTATIEGLLNWNSFTFTDFDLTLEATYDGAIPTPMGNRPGFWIEATTATGEVLMRYNYVPALGWFSHLWIYDLETPEEDIMFHAMSMGVSHNYTGEYLVSDAETLIDRWFGVFPDPGGPVDGDPPVPERFQVGADARLMGIAVPVAVGGRTEVHVVEPDGTDHAYAYQQQDMEGAGFDVHFIDLPGADGDWSWAVAHAGVATGSYTWLSQVTTQASSLG